MTFGASIPDRGEIPLEEAAAGTRISAERLQKLLARRVTVDAHIDLRLGHYCGMPEGLFLRLQNGYDLE